MSSNKASGSQLYESDYYAWVLEQVKALREHRIEGVDWENLAEEIDDLGKSERRAVENQMIRLLEHLLELRYARTAQRRNNVRGWEITVKDARLALGDLLDENPSLRPQLNEIFQRGFRRSRLAALAATRLSDDQVPQSSRWTIEQVMDEHFFSVCPMIHYPSIRSANKVFKTPHYGCG
jgi:Domain of unknown function DUF29